MIYIFGVGERTNERTDGRTAGRTKVFQEVLADLKTKTMVHTVAGGGGAILDDDILSPESEAGKSYDWLE